MSRRHFTVLTLNLGVMRIFGYAPVPHIRERLAAFPRLLRAIDADVVCLQEIWGTWQYERLQADLADAYPYHTAFPTDRDATFLPTGLCIFSREELEEPHPDEDDHIVFAGFPAWHEYIARKGAIAARVHTPLGLTAVVNTHLVSGGPFFSPNGRHMRKMRGRQVDDLAHFAGRQQAHVCIIAGDLNAGPLHSVENFEALKRHGYADTHDLTSPHRRDGLVTWDKENPLNASDIHGASDRIDHVFLAERHLREARVTSWRVVLHERAVDIGKGRTCPVSDHSGLLVTFERR